MFTTAPHLLKVLLPISCIFWAGAILGLSFIATPIKFHAPNITFPVALGVGQVTFQLFNKIEWGLIILLFASAYFYPGNQSKWIVCVVILGLLLLQTIWLLPILDNRLNQILDGQKVAETIHHWIYVAIETAKFSLLFGYGFYLINIGFQFFARR